MKEKNHGTAHLIIAYHGSITNTAVNTDLTEIKVTVEKHKRHVLPAS